MKTFYHSGIRSGHARVLSELKRIEKTLCRKFPLVDEATIRQIVRDEFVNGNAAKRAEKHTITSFFFIFLERKASERLKGIAPSQSEQKEHALGET